VRLRHVLTMILMGIAISSVALLTYLLMHMYAPPELTAMCSSVQIVFMVLSAAAGVLALIKYWNSVEARIEQQQWEKLQYLETSFENFRKRNINVIQAFEWPHLLRTKYVPLCVKALAYDEADEKDQSKMLTREEMVTIRELDDFLEYFESLYFAVSRRLVRVEDLFIFLGYYIKLLDEVYHESADCRLRDYINEYYYNMGALLDGCRKKLKNTWELRQYKTRGDVGSST